MHYKDIFTYFATSVLEPLLLIVGLPGPLEPHVSHRSNRCAAWGFVFWARAAYINPSSSGKQRQQFEEKSSRKIAVWKPSCDTRILGKLISSNEGLLNSACGICLMWRCRVL